MCVNSIMVANGHSASKAGFWGLVEQKGPWKQTASDIARSKEKVSFPKGGGIGYGGTKNASHGNWKSRMNPYTVQGGKPPPKPSRLAQKKVTARDLGSGEMGGMKFKIPKSKGTPLEPDMANPETGGAGGNDLGPNRRESIISGDFYSTRDTSSNMSIDSWYDNIEKNIDEKKKYVFPKEEPQAPQKRKNSSDAGVGKKIKKPEAPTPSVTIKRKNSADVGVGKKTKPNPRFDPLDIKPKSPLTKGIKRKNDDKYGDSKRMKLNPRFDPLDIKPVTKNQSVKRKGEGMHTVNKLKKTGNIPGGKRRNAGLRINTSNLPSSRQGGVRDSNVRAEQGSTAAKNAKDVKAKLPSVTKRGKK